MKVRILGILNLHFFIFLLARSYYSRFLSFSPNRDRFLGGQPISDANESWKRRTGPESKWSYYWYNYWLPTLISSGRVAPSWEFTEMLRQNLEVFDFISKHHVLKDRRVVITKKNDFNNQDEFIGTYMTVIGRQKGLEDAVAFAYGNVTEQLKAHYGNVSFSFAEFLEFVVWSNEQGVPDNHWTPYSELCVPCNQDYQYILHLETIAQESEVLLDDVGYPKKIRLPVRYRSKERSYGQDLGYYKNVPKNLMEKILQIYETDFDIFGYSKDEVLN